MQERKLICVDVDGVLAEYDGFRGIDTIGEPLPGAVAFTKRLLKIADVMIYTTRASSYENKGYTENDLVQQLRNWLDRYGFAYTSIYAGQGKPRASAYIDDRAVSCRPQHDDAAYDNAMSQAERLCVSN